MVLVRSIYSWVLTVSLSSFLYSIQSYTMDNLVKTKQDTTGDQPVKHFDIPKTCKAGVVENEGPDFRLVVEDVPVPEPGEQSLDLFV
jgi:hypothetical protein